MTDSLANYRPKLSAIIGAAMTVHSELHWGLDEPIYQEALSIELSSRGIEWERECKINTYYRGVKMKKEYSADFMCGDILVELKAVRDLATEHRQQLFNYMRLTHTSVGLLINFGEPSLKFEKYFLNLQTNEISIFH